MNAYELADELENYVWMNPNNNRDYCKEVKDKLRQQANDVGSLNARLKQQADRIAELSKNVDELEEELLKTPQIKELSDEEILSFTGFKKNPYDIFIEYEKEDIIDFARAILKKASEK